jgi:APA family basic amino acid/polyamine antiporter
VSPERLPIAWPVAISTQQAVAVSVICLLTAVNLRGIRAGKWVQNVFALAKLAALAGLICIGFMAKAVPRTENSWALIAQGRTVPWAEFLPVLGIAMVGALFAYDAWNNITFTAGEVIRPSRTVPLGLAFGVVLVMAVYILVNLTYVRNLSVAGMQHAAGDRVATAAAQAVLGSRAGALMAAAILIATFGSDNGMILAGSRVYYAMARDGLFFRTAGTLNAHGVPAGSLLLQAGWACLLTLSGTYGNLVDYVIFAALMFYVLTVAAVFRLRRLHPGARRPYAAFGYPVAPLIYIGAAVLIMAALLAKKPQFTGRGLAIVMLGVPVYMLWRRISPGVPSAIPWHARNERGPVRRHGRDRDSAELSG